MLIDRSHRPWAVFTLLLLVIATALYVAYARSWPGGPSGRTWPGMAFGVAATLLMLFAGLLSVRKRSLRWRLGSISWWLKGHLWLGTLSVPLVVYHAAFRWGGTLETLLWVALAVVIASGVIGIILQNILPRAMHLQLPEEIVPDQLAEYCRRLISVADEIVAKQCAAAAVAAAIQGTGEELTSPQTNPRDRLAGFYIHSLRPFLRSEYAADSPFANAQQSQLTFERLRDSLPADFHHVVDGLEAFCQDRRRLAQQARLHGLLHAWLRVHVPVSIALLVFTVLHIVTALYF
ncbi:MAG TPA: hypothetical protein VGM76_08480 [Lacipirellulaceae bacterium]|jgi:hypothetical protein